MTIIRRLYSFDPVPVCPFELDEAAAFRGWWIQPPPGAAFGGALADVCIGSVTTVSPQVSVREWGLHMTSEAPHALQEFVGRSSGRLWRVEGWGKADKEQYSNSTGRECRLYAFEKRRYLGCIETEPIFRNWLRRIFAARMRAHPDFQLYCDHPDIVSMMTWADKDTPVTASKLSDLAYRYPGCKLVTAVGMPFRCWTDDAVAAMSDRLACTAYPLSLEARLRQRTQEAGVPSLEDECLRGLAEQDQSRYMAVSGYLSEKEMEQYRRACRNSTRP